MSNRTTIADATDMTVGDLTKLPALEIAALLDEIDEGARGLAALKKKLKAAVEEKYADRLQTHQTGTSTFDDGEAEIKFTTGKKVEWDQEELHTSWGLLAEQWGEDPSEYINQTLSVSETKYKSWPSAIKKLFEGARAVKPGTVSVKISMKEDV